MHRNETVFRYRSGCANLEEKTLIDDSRIFNLYSMIKLLTCTAALQLVGFGVRTHTSKAGSGSLSPLGEFGWGGAAGCLAIIDPDWQLTVMYAQHLLNNQEPYVHPRLRNIVSACL